MGISRSTVNLFRSWHAGEPYGVKSLAADWAPRYKKCGYATRITYASDKWVQIGDVPATYEHLFEGRPAYIWIPDPSGKRLSLSNSVARLGDVLELEDDSGSVDRWRKGGAWLVGVNYNTIAIIPRGCRTVPIVITNTLVTAEGLDDKT